MDFVSARHHMVDSQVRPNGITDERVISAMAAVPRELFVPPPQRWLAYADQDIELSSPASGRRFLLRPMNFARMIQLLAMRTEDNVLDVGCCNGYSSAVLAKLCKTVTSLEVNAELAAQAEKTLAKLGIGNVKIIVAEHVGGHIVGGPYDAILLNGRTAEPPLTLMGQLKEHGRLAAIVGDEELARIGLYTRNGAFSVIYAFDAAGPVLPGFEAARPAFSF